METPLKVLTPNRWVLLRRLRSQGPSSIRALARALDRDYRGVHADVSALVEAGLIERNERGAIFVPWSRITAEMALDIAACRPHPPPRCRTRSRWRGMRRCSTRAKNGRAAGREREGQ